MNIVDITICKNPSSNGFFIVGFNNRPLLYESPFYYLNKLGGWSTYVTDFPINKDLRELVEDGFKYQDMRDS